MMTQQEILNKFRKGEIDYYNIPFCYEKYGPERDEYDVGRMFSALQVVCTIEEWCKGFRPYSGIKKGVVVQPSSELRFVGITDDVLRALQEKTISSRPAQGVLSKYPVVYDLTYEGNLSKVFKIKKHILTLKSGTFIWYDVECMAITRNEVDLMLQHPLVKQFL